MHPATIAFAFVVLLLVTGALQGSMALMGSLVQFAH